MEVRFEGKSMEKIVAQMLAMLAQMKGVNFVGKGDQNGGQDQTAGNSDTRVQG